MEQAIERNDRYTQPEWNTETWKYYCKQNGFGHWWPCLKVKATYGGWCGINIRDRNPFKTLKGAINFIEKHRKAAKRI